MSTKGSKNYNRDRGSGARRSSKTPAERQHYVEELQEAPDVGPTAEDVEAGVEQQSAVAPASTYPPVPVATTERHRVDPRRETEIRFVPRWTISEKIGAAGFLFTVLSGLGWLTWEASALNSASENHTQILTEMRKTQGTYRDFQEQALIRLATLETLMQKLEEQGVDVRDLEKHVKELQVQIRLVEPQAANDRQELRRSLEERIRLVEQEIAVLKEREAIRRPSDPLNTDRMPK